MSFFFNLTQLGVSNPIGTAMLKEGNADIAKKDTSEAQGSYVKFTERLTKHQRTQNDPNQVSIELLIRRSPKYGMYLRGEGVLIIFWVKICF